MWTVTYWSTFLNQRILLGTYPTRKSARLAANGRMTRTCRPIIEKVEN